MPARPPMTAVSLIAWALVLVTAGACSTPSTLRPTLELPGPYVHDFGAKLTTEHLRPRDDRGIIMVEYPSGLEYNPVTIAQSALAHYDRWLRERGEADRVEFMRDADWLAVAQGDDGLWYYDFPNGSMPVPWVSAMAQGQAISVLVRAYALTERDRYLDAATRALATFDDPIGEGGVSMQAGGYVYYEEATPPESPHILNGMVFAMYGALDMARTLDDGHARRLWEAGLDTLEANIGKYDSGTWSYYSQASPPQLATRAYHKLHAELLGELYRISGRSVFRDYAERFDGYSASPPPEVPK